MEQLTPNQMARKFDAEHGPACEYDGACWVYYPDGARREANPLGAYMQPPAQAAERCRAVVRYHELRVARLMREFDAAKEQAKAAVDGDHEANMKKLKRRQRVLRNRRRQLAAAQEAERHARTGRTQEEESQLKQNAPALQQTLALGGVLEVSTGLYTENVPETGTWGGVAYSATATNHVPDHLALLTGQPGACSCADGCGLPVANTLERNGEDKMHHEEEDSLPLPTLNFGTDEPVTNAADEPAGVA